MATATFEGRDASVADMNQALDITAATRAIRP